MRTKTPSALALTFISLAACDPDLDAGEYAALEYDAPDVAELDVAEFDMAELDVDMELSAGGSAVVLLDDSCPPFPLIPCSALSLFQSTAETSHLLSLDDHPSSINYTNTPPGTGDRIWIMGDWNGDGVDSPGYYSKGKFAYTDNPFSPSNLWSTPITLHNWNNNTDNLPLVAGRLHAGYGNDCVGVINSGVNLAGNTTFSLKYWCDLSSSTATGTQWIGAVLPDSSFPAGTHEFTVGDWDGDGIDEMAIRKDQFITYSLDDPASGPATCPQAQRWGVPPGELAETGVFVSGDWNGDGVDGWGVLYDDNHFYFRNDLRWNPGATAYYLQHIDNLFSDRSVSSQQFGL